MRDASNRNLKTRRRLAIRVQPFRTSRVVLPDPNPQSRSQVGRATSCGQRAGLQGVAALATTPTEMLLGELWK